MDTFKREVCVCAGRECVSQRRVSKGGVMTPPSLFSLVFLAPV